MFLKDDLDIPIPETQDRCYTCQDQKDCPELMSMNDGIYLKHVTLKDCSGHKLAYSLEVEK